MSSEVRPDHVDEYRERRKRLGFDDSPKPVVYPSVKMRQESIQRLYGRCPTSFERDLEEDGPKSCPHCGSRLTGSWTLAEIARAICKKFHVTMADLRGPRATPARLVEARMEALVESFERTRHSASTIAAFYHRDHSCVPYARKWIRARNRKRAGGEQ